MKGRGNAWCASLAALALMACGHSMPVDYSEFHDFGGNDWIGERSLEFSPLPTDSSLMYLPDGRRKANVPRYQLLLALRHTAKFPYKTLWISVETSGDDGVISRDTVALELADKNGRWLGTGSHNLFSITQPIATDLVIPEGYHVSLTHAMDRDTLPGINNIGLILERQNR